MPQAIVLQTGGRFEAKEIPDSLEGLQESVGGLIGIQGIGPGLSLVYRDEAILEDLDPNLWGLVLGCPFQGPLLLIRERAGRRIDVTNHDVARMEILREKLRERLVKVGLVAAEPHMVFFSWSGDTPDDLQPKP